jgi:hypothetical protein
VHKATIKITIRPNSVQDAWMFPSGTTPPVPLRVMIAPTVAAKGHAPGLSGNVPATINGTPNCWAGATDARGRLTVTYTSSDVLGDVDVYVLPAREVERYDPYAPQDPSPWPMPDDEPNRPITLACVKISQVWDAADAYDFDLPLYDTLGEEQTRTMRLRLAMNVPIANHAVKFYLKTITVRAVEIDIEAGVETPCRGTFVVPDDGSDPPDLPFGLTLADLISYAVDTTETAAGDYTAKQTRHCWSAMQAVNGGWLWREAWTENFEFGMYDTTVHVQEGQQ